MPRRDDTRPDTIGEVVDGRLDPRLHALACQMTAAEDDVDRLAPERAQRAERYIGPPRITMESHEIEASQRTFCRERNAHFQNTPGQSKLGFALATEGSRPMNGLRHLPAADTNGGYIWFGEELSTAPDFFAPAAAAPSAPTFTSRALRVN